MRSRKGAHDQIQSLSRSYPERLTGTLSVDANPWPPGHGSRETASTLALPCAKRTCTWSTGLSGALAREWDKQCYGEVVLVIM
jgi:hypothetical protein